MEGLPIMVVSAMLSARPCFVTDVGGHSEVIEDGVCGFIAPNPSVEDVRRLLENALGARERWSSMGEAARQAILNYLPDDPVADFLSKLEEVVTAAPSDRVR